MKTVEIPFQSSSIKADLPDQVDVLSMKSPKPIPNEGAAIESALSRPIRSRTIEEIVEAKSAQTPQAKAVIVISDNTRPVPYKGSNGIVWPIIERLHKSGIAMQDITILVATGTHRAMTTTELQSILDPRIFLHDISVVNHDCKDSSRLRYLGVTNRGTKVYMNARYLDADIKILTGLVESHFMAGVSGGRKSICPGLLGEEGTYIFHGADILASENVRDLNLRNNPVHEEALEVATMAGVDFIVNVTLDHRFRLTGVFAGDVVYAHEAAANRVKEYVAIPIDTPYDIVLTHGGFVGINHYQVGKVAVVVAQALKEQGHLVVVADNTDADPVGSLNYKTVLYLLKSFGAKRFLQLIQSPDWTFIPEQWQVQMWAKLFAKISHDHFIYYSPQFTTEQYQLIPGVDGNVLLDDGQPYTGSLNVVPKIFTHAIEQASNKLKNAGVDNPRIAYLADGPYGIPQINCP